MQTLLKRPAAAIRAVRRVVHPTGKEVFLDRQGLIVSKTDMKGRIIYANRTFIEISGFRECELLGVPHSIIRHPEMPRAVFQLLWQRIAAGHEIFAYVVNLCRNGDHYWVHAHVTPSFGRDGSIIGYHSNRRAVEKTAIRQIKPIYADLLAIEARHQNRRDGLQASREQLEQTLSNAGTDYDAFIASI